jgi:hypothetical protein
MLDVEQSMARSIAEIDVPRVQGTFRGQDEFVFLDGMLGQELMALLTAEVERLRRDGLVNRSWVPFYKKGGSVSFFTLRERAPAMVALYRSPALRGFLEQLVGRPLHLCPDDDPHSCALFLYDRRGDHVGFHYDSCHYEKGVVYTVLVGLVDRSSMKLVCRLYNDKKDRPTQEIDLRTSPGSLVFYNGCSVYHGTSRLGRAEERVVFSMEYLIRPYMHPARRLFANVDHAIRYFGVSGFRGASRGKPPAG